MNSMSLFNRLLGSIIDKVLILVVFGIVYAIIVPEAFSKMMYYVVHIINVSPSLYKLASVVDVSYVHYGFCNSATIEYFQKWYTEDSYGVIVRNFDLIITFAFVIWNMFYYLVFEITLGASIGKYLMRGHLVDTFDGDKISKTDAFKRAIFCGTFMSIVIGLRFLFDINYLVAIVMFFAILDIPVLIKRKSLLDICSGTIYINNRFDTSKEILEKDIVNEDQIRTDEDNCVMEVAECCQSKEHYIFKMQSFPKLKQFRSLKILDLKKFCIYLYIVWVSINIAILAYAMANPHIIHMGRFSETKKVTGPFYPFESYNIGTYDFSEFTIYVVAVPLCLFGIIKIMQLLLESHHN